jgi:pimeloyl-ACP methyl ester carboxylesterase
MRSSEIEALGELAGEALAAGGNLVRGMHEGIAGRPFQALGVAAMPVRLIHDGITRRVYGGIREGLRGAASGAAGYAAGRATTDEEPPLTSNPIASLAVSALNGIYGNHLRARGNALALDMEIRARGERVAPSAAEIEAAFPEATQRVAVFVHGLCGNEDVWRYIPRRDARKDRRSYGERLRDELGVTPVYIRYNTGLHVSDNGRALGGLLDELVQAWPVDVEELVLIGHSMGGLVGRSACHYGELDERGWTEAVRHVFCLGTPHLGADLEKGANALGDALNRLPETQPFAQLLNARSVGIKDLRFGSCVEEDWCDCDPDEFLRDRCREVPFLACANYYFVGATLARGPLGTLLGDLLVRIPSASGRGNGRGRRIPFEVDNGCELTGLNHFDLMNHPAVYAQIRMWITRGPGEQALQGPGGEPGRVTLPG